MKLPDATDVVTRMRERDTARQPKMLSMNDISRIKNVTRHYAKRFLLEYGIQVGRARYVKEEVFKSTFDEWYEDYRRTAMINAHRI